MHSSEVILTTGIAVVVLIICFGMFMEYKLDQRKLDIWEASECVYEMEVS